MEQFDTHFTEDYRWVPLSVNKADEIKVEVNEDKSSHCGTERGLKQEDPHSNPSTRSVLGHVIFKKVYRNDSSAIAETIFLLYGFVSICQAKPGYNTKCVTLKKKML